MAYEQPHWGKWVIARSRFMGFRRQQDLAVEIGITVSCLCRWLAMEKPPERMLKGSDAALSRVLRVDRKTLFTDYIKTPPSTEPAAGQIAAA